MKPENRLFLEQWKPFYEKHLRDGTIHMHMEDRRKMLKVIREEFDKNYVADVSCGPCLTDLLKMAYNNFNEAEQLTEEPVEPTIHMTFPKIDPVPDEDYVPIEIISKEKLAKLKPKK
jgi:hypothetical protein